MVVVLSFVAGCPVTIGALIQNLEMVQLWSIMGNWAVCVSPWIPLVSCILIAFWPKHRRFPVAPAVTIQVPQHSPRFPQGRYQLWWDTVKRRVSDAGWATWMGCPPKTTGLSLHRLVSAFVGCRRWWLVPSNWWQQLGCGNRMQSYYHVVSAGLSHRRVWLQWDCNETSSQLRSTWLIPHFPFPAQIPPKPSLPHGIRHVHRFWDFWADGQVKMIGSQKTNGQKVCFGFVGGRSCVSQETSCFNGPKRWRGSREK